MEVPCFSHRKEVIGVKKKEMHIAAAQETPPPPSLSSSLTPAAVINVSLYSGQKTASYDVLVRRQLIFPPVNRAEYILNLFFHRGGR